MFVTSLGSTDNLVIILLLFSLTLAVQSPMVKKFLGKNGLRCNDNDNLNVNYFSFDDTCSSKTMQSKKKLLC